MKDDLNFVLGNFLYATSFYLDEIWKKTSKFLWKEDDLKNNAA